MTKGTETLISVRNLEKSFVSRAGWGSESLRLRAVDGVDFDVAAGETLGLVGESGCGKSTVGKLVLRLIEPNAGSMKLSGQDVLQMTGPDLKAFRRQCQIVFQDPFSSLNPRLSIGQIIAEPLFVQGLGTPATRRARALELLERVGLRTEHAKRYAHEFSGGQRQRVAIARALATNPKFIVCDEAVSALDVSVQAQILALLDELQKSLSVSYLFISHNLAVVRQISHRISVMYLGKIVETAQAQPLFEAPSHPYTQALLSAVPRVDLTGRRERIVLRSDPPSPLTPPSGCRFHTRCIHARPVCSNVEPLLREVAPGHAAACHFAGELGPATPGRA